MRGLTPWETHYGSERERARVCEGEREMGRGGVCRARKLPAEISCRNSLKHAALDEYRSVQCGRIMFLLSPRTEDRIKERERDREKEGEMFL